MPGKRKRDEFTLPAHKRHRPTPSKQVAEAKIHHGKQLLARALKLAKGFERQKLSRRQKTAQSEENAADIERIAAEIQALKLLDLHAAAEIHVHKALLKEKALRESPVLPPEVAERAKVNLNKATANITARLWASAPVKKAMDELMPPIRLALGVDEGSLKKQKQKSEAASRGTGDAETTSADSAEAEHSDDGSDLAEEHGSQSDDGGFEEEEAGGEAEGSLDFAEFDNRVGADSDDESLDLEAIKEDQRYRRAAELSLSPSPEPMPDAEFEEGLEDIDSDATGLGDFDDIGSETATSENESIDDGSEVDEDRTSRPLPRPKETKTQSIADTMFLPTLTTTGYISGSESEASDLEDDKPRKNRRGQRARQKIWEAKYGRGAKHLTQTDSKNNGSNSRDAGWDMKRGAREEGSSERARGRGRGGMSSSWSSSRGGKQVITGANGDAVVPRAGRQFGEASQQASGPAPRNRAERRAAEGKTAAGSRKPTTKKMSHRPSSGPAPASIRSTAAPGADKPLHPSWEAARKAKETKAANVGFAGKRVTFD